MNKLYCPFPVGCCESCHQDAEEAGIELLVSNDFLLCCCTHYWEFKELGVDVEDEEAVRKLFPSEE